MLVEAKKGKSQKKSSTPISYGRGIQTPTGQEGEEKRRQQSVGTGTNTPSIGEREGREGEGEEQRRQKTTGTGTGGDIEGGKESGGESEEDEERKGRGGEERKTSTTGTSTDDNSEVGREGEGEEVQTPVNQGGEGEGREIQTPTGKGEEGREGEGEVERKTSTTGVGTNTPIGNGDGAQGGEGDGEGGKESGGESGEDEERKGKGGEERKTSITGIGTNTPTGDKGRTQDGEDEGQGTLGREGINTTVATSTTGVGTNTPIGNGDGAQGEEGERQGEQTPTVQEGEEKRRQQSVGTGTNTPSIGEREGREGEGEEQRRQKTTGTGTGGDIEGGKESGGESGEDKERKGKGGEERKTSTTGTSTDDNSEVGREGEGEEVQTPVNQGGEGEGREIQTPTGKGEEGREGEGEVERKTSTTGVGTNTPIGNGDGAQGGEGDGEGGKESGGESGEDEERKGKGGEERKTSITGIGTNTPTGDKGRTQDGEDEGQGTLGREGINTTVATSTTGVGTNTPIGNGDGAQGEEGERQGEQTPTVQEGEEKRRQQSVGTGTNTPSIGEREGREGEGEEQRRQKTTGTGTGGDIEGGKESGGESEEDEGQGIQSGGEREYQNTGSSSSNSAISLLPRSSYSSVETQSGAGDSEDEKEREFTEKEGKNTEFSRPNSASSTSTITTDRESSRRYLTPLSDTHKIEQEEHTSKLQNNLATQLQHILPNVPKRLQIKISGNHNQLLLGSNSILSSSSSSKEAVINHSHKIRATTSGNITVSPEKENTIKANANLRVNLEDQLRGVLLDVDGVTIDISGNGNVLLVGDHSTFVVEGDGRGNQSFLIARQEATTQTIIEKEDDSVLPHSPTVPLAPASSLAGVEDYSLHQQVTKVPTQEIGTQTSVATQISSRHQTAPKHHNIEFDISKARSTVSISNYSSESEEDRESVVSGVSSATSSSEEERRTVSDERERAQGEENEVVQRREEVIQSNAGGEEVQRRMLHSEEGEKRVPSITDSTTAGAEGVIEGQGGNLGGEGDEGERVHGRQSGGIREVGREGEGQGGGVEEGEENDERLQSTDAEGAPPMTSSSGEVTSGGQQGTQDIEVQQQRRDQQEGITQSDGDEGVPPMTSSSGEVTSGGQQGTQDVEAQQQRRDQQEGITQSDGGEGVPPMTSSSGEVTSGGQQGTQDVEAQQQRRDQQEGITQSDGGEEGEARSNISSQSQEALPPSKKGQRPTSAPVRGRERSTERIQRPSSAPAQGRGKNEEQSTVAGKDGSGGKIGSDSPDGGDPNNTSSNSPIPSNEMKNDSLVELTHDKTGEDSVYLFSKKTAIYISNGQDFIRKYSKGKGELLEDDKNNLEKLPNHTVKQVHKLKSEVREKFLSTKTHYRNDVAIDYQSLDMVCEGHCTTSMTLDSKKMPVVVFNIPDIDIEMDNLPPDVYVNIPGYDNLKIKIEFNPETKKATICDKPFKIEGGEYVEKTLLSTKETKVFNKVAAQTTVLTRKFNTKTENLEEEVESPSPTPIPIPQAKPQYPQLGTQLQSPEKHSSTLL